MSWHNMALVRIAGATAHRNVIPYSMSVYLVRHCSAEGQDPEAALTRAGKEQSLQLSAYLERQGLTRVISSPFRRAVDSARPLAETLGLEIEVDPRLAERQLGLVENGARHFERVLMIIIFVYQTENHHFQRKLVGLQCCMPSFKKRDSQPQPSVMVTCWRLLRIHWTAPLVLTFGDN